MKYHKWTCLQGSKVQLFLYFVGSFLTSKTFCHKNQTLFSCGCWDVTDQQSSCSHTVAAASLTPSMPPRRALTAWTMAAQPLGLSALTQWPHTEMFSYSELPHSNLFTPTPHLKEHPLLPPPPSPPNNNTGRCKGSAVRHGNPLSLSSWHTHTFLTYHTLRHSRTQECLTHIALRGKTHRRWAPSAAVRGDPTVRFISPLRSLLAAGTITLRQTQYFCHRRWDAAFP